MTSTYVNDLRLNEMATGDASGSWGTVTNTNLELIGEALGYGTEAITTNADTHTSTIADGATDPIRAIFIKYTGTLDSACTITIGPNTVNKFCFIHNATSGSQSIIISQGSGANVTIATGQTKSVYLDGAGSGAAVIDAFATLSVVDLLVDDDLTVAGDVAVTGDYSSATSGTSNLRLGVNAGNSITSGGNYNVVVGDEAGTAITTGDDNVFTGYASGDAITTGSSNVALGKSALGSDVAGARTTALGYQALTTQSFATGTYSYNTAVGYSAGAAVTTGVQNTLIGGLAGDALTVGVRNVALSANALSTDTQGSHSIAIGYNSLFNQNFTTATETYNTAVGYNTGSSVTTGLGNTLTGGLAGDTML
jgi:hypothetical protein